MKPQILGISGSPIKDSNTDRLVKAMIEASGYEYEFIKLSKINVKPCYGCKLCVSDNICKVKDDFPELAEKIKNADAIVIGSYTPFLLLDSFTQSFFERFWSFSHKGNVLTGKKCATILSGLMPDVLDSVNKYFVHKLEGKMNMDLVGQVSVQGNLPCSSCKEVDTCSTGTKNIEVFPEREYRDAEHQQDTMDQVVEIGRLLGAR